MADPAPPLPRPFSLYLDCCRFLAAVLVVVSHFRPYGAIAAGSGYWWLGLGRESVVVFFVLSGFVIAYTAERKPTGLRGYCVARCTRIYSVALPVALLAFGAAALLVLAKLATPQQFYQLGKPWLYLPLHLLFMGELWTLSETPPLLAPYWSLGYEVWYYALFGAAFYLRGRRRLLAVGAMLLFVGPKLWLLLPVWLAGVAAYHWQKTHTLGRTQALAGWVLSLLLLAAFKASELDAALRALAHAGWPFPGLPLKSADRFLADYVVCMLVVMNFLCARSAGLGLLLRIERPVRWLAAYTFTLYLAHALVMQVWLIVYPHRRTDLADVLSLAAVIVSATLLIGELTEHRKGWCARLFTWAAARLPFAQQAGGAAKSMR
ncbi:acyltransferase family protein [Massilia jejuensis]|uniref:Acyltransferase family protein n=1 Tax=Massilia jejuensis TaxID=648894 RepID=A0ABW0PM90_9BURK